MCRRQLSPELLHDDGDGDGGGGGGDDGDGDGGGRDGGGDGGGGCDGGGDGGDGGGDGGDDANGRSSIYLLLLRAACHPQQRLSSQNAAAQLGSLIFMRLESRRRCASLKKQLCILFLFFASPRALCERTCS